MYSLPFLCWSNKDSLWNLLLQPDAVSTIQCLVSHFATVNELRVFRWACGHQNRPYPPESMALWVQGTKGYRCSETCPPEQEHTLSCLCLLFAWNVDVMAGIRTAILDQGLKALCWRWQVQPKRKNRGSGVWSKLLFKLKNLKFSFFKQRLMYTQKRPKKINSSSFLL